MSEAILLVGGPMDGQWRAVPRRTPRFVYQKLAPMRVSEYDEARPTAEEHYYEQQCIRPDKDTTILCVYTHEGLSMHDAMLKLIQGYKP